MRPIDADYVKSKLNKSALGGHLHYYVCGVIDDAPTIDAEPVKHGHWIDNHNKTWSCSICQSWIPDEQHNYARHCLHCGAKMDGDSE